MSRQLDVEYKGLGAKADIIDEFIADLFNHDMNLQRFLGYGITGCTDSQVWTMFTGEGSNGSQRTRVGSHSTYLGTLKNARICVKEKADPKEKLNTEMLKMAFCLEGKVFDLQIGIVELFPKKGAKHFSKSDSLD
ncbi:hypothetical protein BGZ54_007210 [Gamsiella multidivaricata]|nr:hypothetical protein BGZ54_007210 [Gamsiella multidivaricata]